MSQDKKVKYNLWATPSEVIHEGLKKIRLERLDLKPVKYDGKRNQSTLKFGKNK